MRGNQQPGPVRRSLLPGAVLCALALATVGCGGSSRSSSGTADVSAPSASQHAGQTPARSGADVGSLAVQTFGGARSEQRRPHAPHHGSDEAQKAVATQMGRQTPDSTRDDRSETGAQRLDPCTLVSLSEAQTITRGHLEGPIEAPLGPTCIYRTSRPGPDITVAVESMSFPQIIRHLARRHRLTLSGHRAYCGRLGAVMLIVALPHRRLLNVAAPCRVAQQFATLALQRLAA